MSQGRFVLLVLDGLGVGEMPDVKENRPQDIGSNTLKNIIQNNPKIEIPNLRKLGIVDYFLNNKFKNSKFSSYQLSLGKFLLAHYGADSFVGHQEISGTRPKKPLQQFIIDKKDEIIAILKKNNIDAKYTRGIILIKNNIAISDNIESDYGFNISLVGSLDTNSFEKITSIAKIVRQVVQVGRVITMGGVNVDEKRLFSCIEHKTINGKEVYGINVPKLNIYNKDYLVVHLGTTILIEKQAPQILSKNNYPVVLIGKAADIISADKAMYFPLVHTEEVIDCLIDKIDKIDKGLIFANVQETDLSGHRRDVLEFSRHLELVDKAIPKILKRLGKNDVFVITGDHGNDPTIGHPFHTREFTPLIMFSNNISSKDFGVRKTLADIGASICKYFSLGSTESGTSFIP